MTIGVFVKEKYKKAGIGRFLESLGVPFLSNRSDQIEFIYFADLSEHNDKEYDVAIYGGCIPEDLEKSTVSKNKFYTFCSPFGQADLSSQEFYSSETALLVDLLNRLKMGRIKGVLTQSKSLASRFGFIYIPPVKKLDDKHVNFTFDRKYYSFIGNNFRKHRNVVNQLAAISMLYPKEPIIVSNADAYKYYAQIFNCQFAQQSIEDDNEYMLAISQHRLAFQCSFSEAFSYIAYEYAIQGVPCLCGPTIDWYPIKACKVYNPDSWSEIYSKAQFLLDDQSRYRDISYELAEFALSMAKKNVTWLAEVVNENFIKLS